MSGSPHADVQCRRCGRLVPADQVAAHLGRAHMAEYDRWPDGRLVIVDTTLTAASFLR